MSTNFKIKLLTFIRYFGDSFFYPFLAIYLHSLDYGETRIGILVALTPLIGIIVNPLYSKLCKNAKTLKIVLGVIGIIEGLGIIALSLVHSYSLVLAIIITIAITGTSHYGLLDSLSTIYSEFHHINFSNIRVYGSIAYAIGTTLSGFAIEWLGYTFSFGICFFLFVISSILYFTLGEVNNRVEEEKEKRSYKEVFTNEGFMLYFAFYFVLYGTMKTNQHLYGLLTEYRGINNSQFGIIYTSFVLVEAITLVILDKFDKKLKYEHVLFWIALQSIAMYFVNGSSLPTMVLLIVGLVRGTSYAMLLHVNYKIVVKLVGVRNATIGILLLELAISIFVILGDSIGGYVIEHTTFREYYWILGVLQSLALIFYLIFVRKFIKKVDEARKEEMLGVENEKV